MHGTEGATLALFDLLDRSKIKALPRLGAGKFLPTVPMVSTCRYERSAEKMGAEYEIHNYVANSCLQKE
jgi:hypothetical protein